MTELIILIIVVALLFILFVATLILFFFKKSKKWIFISLISLLLMIFTGVYTLYFGLKKGYKETTNYVNHSLENVFPTFDSDKSDTENNKKHFRNFLNVEITPDVKNIYCFDDAIGADVDYMFAFNCDSMTIKRIIEVNELVKDSIPGGNQEGLQHDFFWWDKERINELIGYKRTTSDGREGAKTYNRILWYDESNGKAYYFEYSL